MNWKQFLKKTPQLTKTALKLQAVQEQCDSGLSPFPGSLFKYFFQMCHALLTVPRKLKDLSRSENVAWPLGADNGCFVPSRP